MRLIKYINESDDSLAYQILKEGKPYFDLVRKTKVKNKFLWRGSEYNILIYKKLKVRKNRKPSDTCNDFHDMADKFFYKIFNIKARSETLFCFSSQNYAKHYGSYTNIVIPIGKFNYIWSTEIKDFFTNFEYSDIYDLICNNDNHLYDIYISMYGIGENGTLYYKGKDTGEKYIDDASLKIYKENYEKDKIDYDIIEKIEQQLKWVPDLEYEEWTDKYEKNNIDELYSIIKNNYIKNEKFKDLMDDSKYKKNEIMLDCNYYYILNEKWVKENLEPLI